MAIDVWQFWPTYFDESLEGLNSMESDLLSLDPGAADQETVDSIFRVAHSIKGGSGTFGLTKISDFTHHVETLLDQIRSGEREVTEVAVTVLLSSVDCLRWMLDEANSRSEIDEGRATPIVEALLKIMSTDEAEDDESEALSKTEAELELSDQADADSDEAEDDESEAPSKTELELSDQADADSREAEDAEISSEAKADTDEPDTGAEDDGVPTLEKDGFELFGYTAEDEADPSSEDDDTDVVSDAEPEVAAESGPPAETPTSETPAEVHPLRRSTDSPHPQRRASDQPGATPPAKARSLRVTTEKVDSLVNLVGEMVIVQSMLNEIGDGFEMGRIDALRVGLEQLEQTTRELQDSVMQVRMEPISNAFQPMPRLVHDLSQKLGKEARLVMTGEMTELDKTVAERISDSLMHLVRNALDHGIETPDEREAAGKDRVGTVRLSAEHSGGQIVIEVSDDGAGLNPTKIRAKAIERGLLEPGDKSSDADLFDLIFHAGLSTAAEVSDVSGRGVGMDVVRRNVRALGGTITLDSAIGKGSSIKIHLPLTLAIIEGQLVRIGEETFVVPLLSIIESVKMEKSRTTWVPELGPVYHFRGEHISIVPLFDRFSIVPDSKKLEDGMLVVVEGEGHTAGLVVDELLGHRQVVVKNLHNNYEEVEGIAGATILGDGTVALILNVGGVISMSGKPLLASA